MSRTLGAPDAISERATSGGAEENTGLVWWQRENNEGVSSQASVGMPPRAVVGYRLATLTAVLLPLITALASAGRWAARNPLPFAESRLDPAMFAVLLVAAALVPAAAFAAGSRTRSAVGLLMASIGSQLPFWAAWPGLSDELRSAALAAAPLTIAGVAASVHGWTARSPSKALRASYLFVALAVTVHLLGYDPFADPGCARICGDVAVPLEFAVTAQGAVRIVAGLSVLAVGFGATAVLRSRAPSLLMGFGLAALGLLAVLAMTRWLAWGDPRVASWLILLGPLAPGLVASAICAVALTTARSRRAVSDLVDSLSSPEESLGVAYAVPGSHRWVDAEGRESSPDGAGVVLEDESGPVMRLAPSPGTDQAELLANLTPAAKLALRNAQLSAAATARLTDLHASQRRIIANGDAERRRIERDLHDGAQQRLVSALVQLQLVARDVAAGDRRVILETDRRLRTVLDHLRRLDLDPFPETLSTEGLEAALEELVANSNAPAELHASIGPVSDEIERAVYAFAATVVEVAQHGSPSAQLALRVWEDDGAVHVRARLEAAPGLSPLALIEVADRIGAVGGTVAAEPPATGSISIEAVIPCAP
jgi:signal transduction histidine kinase